MRCIAEANVLLPVLVEVHAHQAPAATWWNACNDGDAAWAFRSASRCSDSCPTPESCSSVLRPAQTWGAVQSLINDPRIEVLDQVPATHGKIWYDDVARSEPSPDLWAGAWLAALAQAQSSA